MSAHKKQTKGGLTGSTPKVKTSGGTKGGAKSADARLSSQKVKK